ncbi:MAG: hypothetical protein JXL80_15220 [Planctomycetes bacterium]|nr:hypothetical protein [Planctomycetota bacterium]
MMMRILTTSLFIALIPATLLFAQMPKLDRGVFQEMSQQERIAVVLAALRIRESRLRNFSYEMTERSHNIDVASGNQTRVFEHNACTMRRKDEGLYFRVTKTSLDGADKGTFATHWDGSVSRSLTRRPEHKNPRGLIWDTESNNFSYYRYNAILGTNVRAGAGGQALTAVEWLENGVAEEKPIDVGWVEQEDRQVISVKIPLGDGIHWRYCFDPNRDFMPVLVEFEARQGNNRDYETTQVTHAKSVDGFWVPMSAICSSGTTSSAEQTEIVYEVSEFVRGAVKDEDLKIAFPPGTEVVDAIRKLAYRVLPDGRCNMLPFADAETGEVLDPRETPLDEALEIAQVGHAAESVPMNPKKADVAQNPFPANTRSPGRSCLWASIAAVGLVLMLIGVRALRARSRCDSH